ncbi:MAG: hypothetical protein ABID84_03540 [Chloroflexota bacterium]
MALGNITPADVLQGKRALILQRRKEAQALVLARQFLWRWAQIRKAGGILHSNQPRIK